MKYQQEKERRRKKMKTGIELIAEERKEQLEKHHQTIEDDINNNPNGELVDGAVALLCNDVEKPYYWDMGRFAKMRSKPRKQKIIIAAALLAAELDRLNLLEESVKQQS